MNLGRAKAKARRAMKKREEEIEQEEIEGGEINLVPYLDIVTNLMLFILSTVSVSLLLGQLNFQLPNSAPPQSTSSSNNPDADPKEKPLGLIVSIERDAAQQWFVRIWSRTGKEGSFKEPKALIPAAGANGSGCVADHQCQSGNCDRTQLVCQPNTSSQIKPIPVFNYQQLNNAIYEIAKRNYGESNQPRNLKTYQVFLMAEPDTPYGTIVAVMDAIRCKLPEADTLASVCQLPLSKEAYEALKKSADASKFKYFFDGTSRAYNPDTDALFHDILFSTLIGAQ